MAITPVTLTGNVHDTVGANVDARRTKVYIVPCDANGAIDRIADPDANEERFPGAKAELDSSTGIYVFPNLWPTNAATNPTGYYYEVFVDYPMPHGGPGRGGGRNTWRSGPFSLTTSAFMADLDLDTPAVSATWRSAFLDQAQELLDAQVAIAGPVDGTVEALVKNTGGVGPLTQAALAAAYAPGSAPTHAGTRLRGYDRRLNTYNAKPSNARRARAGIGKARNGYGTFRIVCIGDSTTAGVGTSSAAVDAYPARIRDELVSSGYFEAGGGIVTGFSNAPGVETRWTLGAGWAAWGDGSSAIGNSTTTNPATFVADLPGTIVRVFYGKNLSAFTVSIDGAAAVTVPVLAGTTGEAAVYEVTGLADTGHTVAIRATGIGNFQMIHGVEVARPSGLSVSSFAVGGMESSGGGHASPWFPGKLAGSAAVAADLVVIGYGINDANNGVSAATYAANMQNAITYAGANGANVVLIAPIPPTGVAMNAHLSALYDLADTNDLPLVDMYDRYGNPATAASLGLMFDALHPSAFGYADIAHSIIEALAL